MGGSAKLSSVAHNVKETGASLHCDSLPLFDRNVYHSFAVEKRVTWVHHYLSSHYNWVCRAGTL